jgi:putative endonuclease
MRTGKTYCVYILASKIGGTIYIGVTNDLIRRVYEHKTKAVGGFTDEHDVDRLVYFEQFDDIENAIVREKRLKKWNRAWKIRLIEEANPDWVDLYPALAGGHIA